MSRAAAIGEAARVTGYALAGVAVLPAEGAEAVREAWRSLEQDVELVILTPAAAAALAEEAGEHPERLRAVLP